MRSALASLVVIDGMVIELVATALTPLLLPIGVTGSCPVTRPATARQSRALPAVLVNE
jgi:hypothetical protein